MSNAGAGSDIKAFANETLSLFNILLRIAVSFSHILSPMLIEF